MQNARENVNSLNVGKTATNPTLTRLNYRHKAVASIDTPDEADFQFRNVEATSCIEEDSVEVALSTAEK